MNAWVLPYRVESFETDRAEVALVLGIPYDDVDLREPILGLRISDADGDAMADIAIERHHCGECDDYGLCGRTLACVLEAVQDQVVRMGAAPAVPAVWHLPINQPVIAELRSPVPGLD